jgi:hypothetical protein
VERKSRKAKGRPKPLFAANTRIRVKVGGGYMDGVYMFANEDGSHRVHVDSDVSTGAIREWKP